jgi:hypothetical protein
MAVELITPNTDKFLAIEILKSIIVEGKPFHKGAQIKVSANDAFDLVHHGQAKFLKPGDVKK